MKKKVKIIIAEDDTYFNQILIKYIQSICNAQNYPEFSFDIRAYKSAKECIEHLDKDTNILILDYFLDEFDDFPYNGFDLMKVVHQTCKDCRVIVISGQRSVTVTTELFKRGIYDYIDKDYMPAKRMTEAVQKILNEARSQLMQKYA
ncbi:MAG: hypothetical protein KatS3mg031_0075 [Chitinophagales bacterium]|nr:MAG: hypothetical protein KatS3mg031_0075 [Chitinophagales bacterium]